MKRGELVTILASLGVHEDRERSNHDKVVAPCPFAPFYHSSGRDAKPSFAAFPNPNGKSGFICLSCHQQGTIHSLAKNLAELRDEADPEILEAISQAESDLEFNFDDFEQLKVRHLEKYTPPPALKWSAGYSDAFDDAHRTTAGRLYLKARGISNATSELLQLKYDDLTKRVLFPVFDREGGFYGFSGRGTLPTVDPKVQDYADLPKQHVILGEQLWAEGKPLLLVEGLFAYARMVELGMHQDYNVGALLGSEMTLSKANKIAAFANPTYLLMDNDEAGFHGMFGRGKKGGAVQRLYGHVSLFVFTWPEVETAIRRGKSTVVNSHLMTLWPDGKTDPDELTASELRIMLSAAQWIDEMPAIPKNMSS